MDTLNKRRRFENEDENGSKRQLEATRIKNSIRQSGVSMSGEPEDSDPLPAPPLRASRHNRKFDTQLGRYVTQTFAPNEYEHEALSRNPSDDQIRLLILHRGNRKDMIHCSFRVHSLAKADGKYEALSYYWGNEGEICEIRILTVAFMKPKLNGCERATEQARTQKFHIRPRLYEALTHLRLPDRDLALWIDALCINQEDEVEKTQQVQKMARIYSAALNVPIWLGGGNKECEEGFEFTDEILDFETFDANVKDESSLPKWTALVELMRQDWFRRRWVIQELALARNATVHYNDKEISWKDFADAITIFTSRFDDIKRLFLHNLEYNQHAEDLGDGRDLQALGASVLVDINANHFRRSSGAADGLKRLSSLELLVSRLSLFEVSDPRDTIYALLSICKKPNGSHKELVPDYTKSIIEVYRDFTEYCVSTSRSVDIICRPWAPAGWSKSATLQHSRVIRNDDKQSNKSRLNAKMPSWVPLLTGSPFGAPHQVPPGRVNGDSLVGLPDTKCYNACGGIFKEPRFEDVSLIITQSMEPRSVSVSQAGRHAKLLAHAPKLGRSQEEAGNVNVGIPDCSGVASPESTFLTFSSGECAQSVAPEHLPPVNAFFMFVTGIHLDTVTEISARIPGGFLTQECLAMGGWEGRDAPKEDVPDELWQTLVAGRGPQGKQPPTFYNRACRGCFALANPSGDINIAILIADPRTPLNLKEFLERVQSVVWNRLFVRSERRKLFGLGPRGTKVNDLICILYGCSVPVILRKQQDHYEVIGECFIYGMMDGEAVGNIDHENDTEEFKLG